MMSSLQKELQDLDEGELDDVLSTFIQQARKSNGDRYPGKTLYELVTSLQKHLEIKHRVTKVLDKENFPSIYFALDASMKTSTELGVGLVIKQAQPVTPEQEVILWEKRLLGDDNPQNLQRALFFLLGINFALRGGKSHRDLTIRNFTVTTDETGRRYLAYTEAVGKTRQGGIKDKKVKTHSARAYELKEANSKRCPVYIFEKYVRLCPQDALEKAFYLKPLIKKTPELWYARVPVGHNTLSNMVKSVMEEGGFKGQYTNHSLRVTTVTRLFDQRQDMKVIQEHTGHRSDAVMTYRRVDDMKKQEISRFLSPCTTTEPKVVVKEENDEPESKKIKCEVSEEESRQDSRYVFNITGGNITIHCSKI